MLYEIKKDEMPEFVGAVIDMFEDFLAERGVTRESIGGKTDDGHADAIIVGNDYDELESGIRSILSQCEADGSDA